MMSELAGVATAHGWMTRSALERVLARSHFFLLPSRSEGFPKVVAEALAFGAVPVVSDVSSIGQVLAETGGGVAVTPGASWIDEVETLIAGAHWAELAAAGPEGAARFSYSAQATSGSKCAGLLDVAPGAEIQACTFTFP